MRTFSKSSKLDNVCYDIRGPVMDEANETPSRMFCEPRAKIIAMGESSKTPRVRRMAECCMNIDMFTPAVT